MLIGSISARYGDAMSGVINITTKSGSANFFGSFEGITSEAFDDFGYNLLSDAGSRSGRNGAVQFSVSFTVWKTAEAFPKPMGKTFSRMSQKT